MPPKSKTEDPKRTSAKRLHNYSALLNFAVGYCRMTQADLASVLLKANLQSPERTVELWAQGKNEPGRARLNDYTKCVARFLKGDRRALVERLAVGGKSLDAAADEIASRFFPANREQEEEALTFFRPRSEPQNGTGGSFRADIGVEHIERSLIVLSPPVDMGPPGKAPALSQPSSLLDEIHEIVEEEERRKRRARDAQECVRRIRAALDETPYYDLIKSPWRTEIYKKRVADLALLSMCRPVPTIEEYKEAIRLLDEPGRLAAEASNAKYRDVVIMPDRVQEPAGESDLG